MAGLGNLRNGCTKQFLTANNLSPLVQMGKDCSQVLHPLWESKGKKTSSASQMLAGFSYSLQLQLLQNMGCPESQPFPLLVPAVSCNRMQVIHRTWLLHNEFTKVRFAKTYFALMIEEGHSGGAGEQDLLHPQTLTQLPSFPALHIESTPWI